MSVPKPPDGLGKRGRQLWRSIARDFELSDAELEILAEACSTADLIDRLAEQLSSEELVVAGSRGQTALHPAASEIRQQRALLAQLIAKLSLRDDDDDSAAARLGQRGAQARWYGRR